MLGLAWCWKWRKFHQWAEKPCAEKGSQEWSQAVPLLGTHTFEQSQRSPNFMPERPPRFTLTFNCPITNCWATWFHLDLVKMKVWPISCCRHQHWAWGKRSRVEGDT